jgi:hypothetical protein
MAVKVNGRWVGENPDEQFQIEKNRYNNKLLCKKNNVVDCKNRKVFFCSK